MRVNWKCPHCGFINGLTFNESDIYRPQIVACDSEEGGCDEYVVVKPWLTASVQVFEIKGVEA